MDERIDAISRTLRETTGVTDVLGLECDVGEPVGSALLAFIIFNEGFAPLQFVGFSLLLVGIYLAAKGERS